MASIGSYTLTVRAQGVGGYTGGLLALTSPTTSMGAGHDDGTASAALGFTFNLDGVGYTTCWLNTNGHLTLGPRISPYPNYSNESGSAGVNASGTYGGNVLVLPWWDDLKTAFTVGYVKHETQGTAPDRVFVAEWHCQGYYNQSASACDTWKMQAVLYEGSDAIEFRYGSITTTGSPNRGSYSASCGVKGDTISGQSGNIRDFFGSGHALGGGDQSFTTAKTAIHSSGSPIHWPGNSNNDLGYAYDFRFSVAPTVTSLSPSTGPDVGGTSVTITGSGFASGATVTVGGAAATSVSVVSSTSITATTPAGTAGGADVTVTNPDTLSDTLAGGFTFQASAPPPAPSLVSFAQAMRCAPMGWSAIYVAKIEGLPQLFVERAGLGASPAGYSQDASLVIDTSAAVGSEVDRRAGIGRGHALTLRLLDTAAVRPLMTTPALSARLTQDLDSAETSAAHVQTSAAWPASGSFHIGTESIAYTSTTLTAGLVTQFNGLTRGQPAGDWKARTHPVASALSTWITSGPLTWAARRVRLYAAPLDPYGRIHGADVMDGASPVWEGVIARQPMREAGGWSITCRSLDRILTDPVATELTGSANLTLNDDPIVPEPFGMVLGTWLDIGGTKVDERTIAPFSTLGQTARLSVIRSRIQTAWNNATGSSLQNMEWRREELWAPGGQFVVRWRAHVLVNWSTTSPLDARVMLVGASPAPSSIEGGSDPFATTGADQWVALDWFINLSQAWADCIEITTDADPSHVPQQGWVTLTADDVTALARFESSSVTGNTVALQLAPGSGIDLGAFVPADTTTFQDIDARISFRDAGAPADLMRRMLLSSGRGDNDATYDTNPAQQGYDLEAVDVDAFDEVFDGHWSGLVADLNMDAEASFAEVFGGLVALSQRAIVQRFSESAGGLALVPVRTTVYETGDYVTTLTDSELALETPSSKPIRPRRTVDNPTSITVDLHKSATSKDGTIGVHDPTAAAQRSLGVVRWGLKAHGMSRDMLAPAVTSWGSSHLAGLDGSEVIDVDVVPWFDAEVGDAILVNLAHFAVWDPVLGQPGYLGPGRVLGRKTKLSTGITTLTVLIGGRFRGMALSPSAEILAYSPSPTAPNAITVDGEHLGLMTRYLDAGSPFWLVVYQPGSDSVGARVAVSLVTDTAGQTVLGIGTIYGSFDLSVGDWRLTLPALSIFPPNPEHARHLHNDADAAWR